MKQRCSGDELGDSEEEPAQRETFARVGDVNEEHEKCDRDRSVEKPPRRRSTVEFEQRTQLERPAEREKSCRRRDRCKLRQGIVADDEKPCAALHDERKRPSSKTVAETA